MLSKNILLAGIAAGALAAAGSAGAVTVTTVSIGNVPSTSAAPFTIASERTVTSTATTSSIQESAAETTVTATLGSSISVPTSFTTTSYLVTWTTSGGVRFNTGVAATATPTGTGLGTAGANTAGASFGNVSFSSDRTTATAILTVTAPTSGTAGTLTGATLVAATELVSGGANGNVNVLFQQGTTGGFVNIDGGASPNALVVQYKAAVNTNPFNTTATTFYASLNSTPQFQAFNTSSTATTGDTSSVNIGTYTLALNSSAAFAGGAFYSTVETTGANTTSAPPTITNVNQIVASGAVTISGPDVNRLTTTVAGVAATAGGTGTNASFTVPAGTNGNIVLAEPTTKVSITPGSYTGSVVFTAQTGYTAPTGASNQALGTVLSQGTYVIAPWVGDGTNGYQGIIRISNINNANLPAFNVVLLNPVNPTPAGTGTAVNGTCAFAASTAPTVTISSNQLQACFGNFGNSDVKITFPVGYTALAAKLRIINASTGVVTEQSVGTGQQLTFGNGYQ